MVIHEDDFDRVIEERIKANQAARSRGSHENRHDPLFAMRCDDPGGHSILKRRGWRFG